MTAQLYSCGKSKDYLKFCVHEGHVHVLLGLQENHIVEGDAKDAALGRQSTWEEHGLYSYKSNMCITNK